MEDEEEEEEQEEPQQQPEAEVRIESIWKEQRDTEEMEKTNLIFGVLSQLGGFMKEKVAQQPQINTANLVIPISNLLEAFPIPHSNVVVSMEALKQWRDDAGSTMKTISVHQMMEEEQEILKKATASTKPSTTKSTKRTKPASSSKFNPPSEINEERGGEEEPPLPSKGKASSKGKTNQQQKKKWNNSQPLKGNMRTRAMTAKKSEVSSLKSPAVESFGGSD